MAMVNGRSVDEKAEVVFVLGLDVCKRECRPDDRAQ